jgi:hypothetical protein
VKAGAREWIALGRAVTGRGRTGRCFARTLDEPGLRRTGAGGARERPRDREQESFRSDHDLD